MSSIAALKRKIAREEYEDRVFRKVMAIYSECESKRIAKEAEILNASSNPIRKEQIVSLFNKIKNPPKKNFQKNLWKRLASLAAAIVLIVAVALDSQVLTIAGIRVKGSSINDKFTEMDVRVFDSAIEYDVSDKKDVYYDEDFLGWEARYKMTYIPQGLKLHHSDTEDPEMDEFYQYRDPNKDYVWLSFNQSHFFMGGGTVYTSYARINTVVKINGYSAIFVSRTYPGNPAVKTSTTVLWAEGDTLIRVSAFNIDPYEVLKVAESVKRVK